METLVLQHIACEPPGTYEDVLLERGARIHRVELDEGEPLPDWRGFDLIVAMGGAMSVNDDAEHPWLTAEKRLIGDAVRAGKPFFGACLGVQLLAASLGATVSAGSRPEVGILDVHLTAAGLADPVTSVLPPTFPSLQWHGDTFDLPDGAVWLMESPAYPNQSFRWGRAAYGVQFHLEVNDAMGDDWSRVPAYAAYADGVLGPGGSERVLAELGRRGDELRTLARRLFTRFLDVAVDR